jgi:hypothetical protein
VSWIGGIHNLPGNFNVQPANLLTKRNWYLVIPNSCGKELCRSRRLLLVTAAQARNVQINIRLSPDEKRAIEEAASKGGFRGISDYLRIRGLAIA